MRASDVMVTKVITAGPQTTVQEIANILLTNRISAVPVVDNGKLVGIVSEGDLMHRVESGTERHHSWWLKLVSDKSELARDFLKSHAVKAADVMSRPVVTAPADMPLGELASLLEKHRIKRVPIVADGKMVGIVSRANLLQALAAMRRDVSSEARVSDAALRDRIQTEIKENLRESALQINVIVHDGSVELWGTVESQDEKDALRVAAELVPGVRRVEDFIGLSKVYSGV